MTRRLCEVLNRIEHLAVELYAKWNSVKEVSELLLLSPRAVSNLVASTGIMRDRSEATIAWRNNVRSRAIIDNFTSLVDVVEHCAHMLNIPVSLLLRVLAERLTVDSQGKPTCIASNCDFDCLRQCARALNEVSETSDSEKGYPDATQ